MPSSIRASARVFVAVLVIAGISSGIVLAQSGTSAPAADPIIAKVDGQPIHLSELKDAAATLPQGAHAMASDKLYPMLLEQLIDARALLAEAHRTGVDKDPAVQRQVKEAEERALETAVLHKAIAPQITDAALKARYEKETASKSGPEEVHARHILVNDEATAKKIIAELDKGGDFAALSKQYSTDPGAAKQGGDLGWFKQDEMVPEFATAAFALQPGQVSQTPVHTQFGWHVIQVLEKRKAPPPSFEQVKDELRQKMIQEGVQQAVAQARAGVKVETFNMDGSPSRATDKAEPPPKQ